MVGWAGHDRAARLGPVGLGPVGLGWAHRAASRHRARREPRGTRLMGGLAARFRRVRLVAAQGPVPQAPTGPAPVAPGSPARDAPVRGSATAPAHDRLHPALDHPPVRAVRARVRHTARPDQGPSCRASAWPARAVARKDDRPRACVGYAIDSDVVSGYARLLLRYHSKTRYLAVVARPSTISRLSAIAAEQWGLVTRRQAERAGVPRATFDRMTSDQGLRERCSV